MQLRPLHWVGLSQCGSQKTADVKVAVSIISSSQCWDSPSWLPPSWKRPTGRSWIPWLPQRCDCNGGRKKVNGTPDGSAGFLDNSWPLIKGLQWFTWARTVGSGSLSGIIRANVVSECRDVTTVPKLGRVAMLRVPGLSLVSIAPSLPFLLVSRHRGRWSQPVMGFWDLRL